MGSDFRKHVNCTCDDCAAASWPPRYIESEAKDIGRDGTKVHIRYRRISDWKGARK